MHSSNEDPCVEFVRQWLPFQLTPVQEALIKRLCAQRMTPKRIAWKILMGLPRLDPEEVDEPSQPSSSEPTPDFCWKLWTDICAWVRQQRLDLDPAIVKEVFLAVVAGQITTLEQAIALLYQLLASTHKPDPGAGPEPKPGGGGPRPFKR
jgi:hypothetical protein